MDKLHMFNHVIEPIMKDNIFERGNTSQALPVPLHKRHACVFQL